jgi:hypothetical protein
MIRFLPDTWRELMLRPIAMAAPDSGVYIEIMAPDLRFVFLAGLIVLLAALVLWRRRTGGGSARPALILTATLLIAMVPWLLTTANGRYFIAGLLVVGPVCLALVWLLPLTRAARLTVAGLLVALRTFAVSQTNPFQAWSLGQWNEAPYFQLEIPEDLRTQPATYLTMSSISYSLLAPQFPAESRWMNLVNAPSVPTGHPDSLRAQQLLAGSTPGHIFLLVPFVPGGVGVDGLPVEEVTRAVDLQLAGHQLRLAQPRNCRLLRSKGLASMALRKEARLDLEKTRHVGFWVCGVVRYDGTPSLPMAAAPLRFDAAFDALEASCPRFFKRGVRSEPVPGGEVRNYSATEMKAYVLDNGYVYYKYYRAFSIERIGTFEDVANGKAKVDCGNIRGRSGLPWEREI